MRSRNSRHLGSGSGIALTLFVDSCACLNPAGDGGSLADEARNRPAALSAARRRRRFAMVETQGSPCGGMTKVRFCFIESEPVPSNGSSAKTKRDVILVSRHPRCRSGSARPSALDRRTAADRTGLLARLTGTKCGPNPRGVGMVNVPSACSPRSSACTYDRSRKGTADCAQSWVLLGEMACAVRRAGATVDPARSSGKSE
jgi:hypothetical protein